MKKLYYVLVLLVVFNAALVSLGAVYVIDNRIELKSIKLVSYDDSNNSIKIVSKLNDEFSFVHPATIPNKNINVVYIMLSFKSFFFV